jgi:hypothetical protein
MAARITRMTKRRLGDILRAEGMLTDEQFKQALIEQRQNNMFLCEALVKLGFVTEDTIARVMAQQFNLPYLCPEQVQVPKEMADLFPISLMREYQFVPLARMAGAVIIAGASLLNHDVLNELERHVQARVYQYISTWRDVQNKLDDLFKDRKVDEESNLTGLGSMLLTEDEEGTETLKGLEEVGTSEVVQEALEAVGALPEASPGGAKGQTGPPSLFGKGMRLSAFAGLDKVKGGEGDGGEEEGVKEGARAKDGLLDVLKK